ncbi:DUF1798 family protein [Pontibacillus halophilus]|uniref:DUF1798 family protein n=1 Tax=Pontibacillus halophilus TaxID=516704 RepID=UPI0018CEAC42|nr:DUF1798 family protein [Pontibacillus halophilus]
MESTVQQLSLEMKEQVDTLYDRFFSQEGKPEVNDRTFFTYMKEETNPIFDLNNRWAGAVEEFLAAYPGGPVYPPQIKNTKENMELVILHSYYIDVPKKRYMELYQSIHYVVNQVLDKYVEVQGSNQ